MISDYDLLTYAQKNLFEEFGDAARLDALLAIGSFAYPEFSRNNSDIDLIALRDGPRQEGRTLCLRMPAFGNERRLIELQIFTLDEFYDYALRCDIAQQYGFVRGYRFIKGNLEAERIVRLAIGRYFSDASLMLCRIRELDLEQHIANIQFWMTDCRNQLLSKRVEQDPLLAMLRVAEVTKDFISQMWIALLVKRNAKRLVNEGAGVNPNSPLLQEVGQLRVFLGLRGGRMVDGGKYPKDGEISELVEQVRSNAGKDIPALVRGMEHMFMAYFHRKLFLTQ